MNKIHKIGFGAAMVSLLLAGGTAQAMSSSTMPGAVVAAKSTPKPTQAAAAPTATPEAAMSTTTDATDATNADVANAEHLTMGRVKSISDNGFVLDVPRKKADAAFVTDSKTVFYVKGAAGASLKDLKKDDDVVLIADAKKNSDKMSSVVAMAVLSKSDDSVSVKADPNVFIVHGPVSDVLDKGFKIEEGRKNKKQTYSVNVGSALVIEPGKADGKLSDLKKGDIASVYGKQSGDTVDASMILLAPDSRNDRYNGIVVGVQGSQLVLFTTTGEQLKVDASKSIFIERGNPAATVSNLKDGHMLALFGIKNSDGSVTAQVIDEFGSLGRPYAQAKTNNQTTMKATATPKPKKP